MSYALTTGDAPGDQTRHRNPEFVHTVSRDKAISTVTARAALAGFALHVLESDASPDAYLVSRWNLSRTLPDVDAVLAFLDQVGAPQ